MSVKFDFFIIEGKSAPQLFKNRGQSMREGAESSSSRKKMTKTYAADLFCSISGKGWGTSDAFSPKPSGANIDITHYRCAESYRLPPSTPNGRNSHREVLAGPIGSTVHSQGSNIEHY